LKKIERETGKSSLVQYALDAQHEMEVIISTINSRKEYMERFPDDDFFKKDIERLIKLFKQKEREYEYYVNLVNEGSKPTPQG
jgi:hypothetical protein